MAQETTYDPTPNRQATLDSLLERVRALATWVDHLDKRVERLERNSPTQGEHL